MVEGTSLINIIIFGYGYTEVKLHRKLENDKAYNVIGFVDNSVCK